MRKNFKIATNFAEEAKEFNGVLSIVLFGSVARGEDKPSSDVDIAIIHELDDMSNLRRKVNRVKEEKIQVTYLNIVKLSDKTELVGALSGEGLLLAGEPVEIKADNVGLESKVIFSYSLSELDQNEKVKASRALNGYKTSTTHKGKRYSSSKAGIKDEAGIEKIGKGVLLVDSRKSSEVKGFFRSFDISYKEIPAWTY